MILIAARVKEETDRIVTQYRKVLRAWIMLNPTYRESSNHAPFFRSEQGDALYAEWTAAFSKRVEAFVLECFIENRMYAPETALAVEQKFRPELAPFEKAIHEHVCSNMCNTGGFKMCGQ